MTRRILAAFAVAALAACGSAPLKDDNKDGIADGVVEPNSVTKVAPSNPIGSMSGIVTNMKFEAVADAQVVLVLSNSGSSAIKTTTDADGAFSFKGLPAGSSGQITVSKASFGTVRFASGTVPSTAGNVPLNDGNVNVGSFSLVSMNASQKFTFLTATGHAAKGVKVYLEVTPTGFQYNTSTSYGSALGRASFEGTTDDNGVVSFTGLPSITELSRAATGAYNLIYTPLDEDGDGRPEMLGGTQNYTATSLLTTPPAPIVMTDARLTNALAIVATNVESLASGNATLRNSLSAAESINVVFNQPVLDSSLQITVVGEDCKTSISTVKTLRGNVLSIAPGTSWANGTKYNIAIRAVSTDGTGTAARQFVGFFFGYDEMSPKIPSTSPSFLVKKNAANMNPANLQAGDELFMLLDSPVRAVGTVTPRAFFNIDLNGNSTIGMNALDPGEFGAPFSTGFALAASEPTFEAMASTFTCATSGYTSRYKINFGTLPLNGIPLGTAVKVTIPRDDTATQGIQTIWGSTINGDYAAASMTLLQ